MFNAQSGWQSAGIIRKLLNPGYNKEKLSFSEENTEYNIMSVGHLERYEEISFQYEVSVWEVQPQ